MNAAIDVGGAVAAARRVLEAERTKLVQLQRRQQAELRDAEFSVAAAVRRYESLSNGVSPADYDAATALFDIWNSAERITGDDSRAIDDAVSELATSGGLRFAHMYVCTKNYDSHWHQYVGWMRNSLQPRHGQVAFQIGLRQNAPCIRPDLVDLCIRFLEAVRRGDVALPRTPAWKRGR